MTFKYYAKLIHPQFNTVRLFEILDYKNGMYHVYIDFIFPMRLNRIVVKQQLEGKG